MAKIELIGEITQITRKGGNNTATVTLKVPQDKAAKLPMGAVNITLEASQSEMFAD